MEMAWDFAYFLELFIDIQISLIKVYLLWKIVHELIYLFRAVRIFLLREE